MKTLSTTALALQKSNVATINTKLGMYKRYPGRILTAEEHKVSVVGDMLGNLLINPSFENNLTGWSSYIVPTNRSVITSSAIEGSYSHKIVSSLSGGSYQNVTVVPGRTYKFSAWIYRVSGSQYISVSNNGVEQFAYQSGAYNVWQKVEGTFVAGTTTISIRLVSTAGEGYFDSVQVFDINDAAGVSVGDSVLNSSCGFGTEFVVTEVFSRDNMTFILKTTGVSWAKTINTDFYIYKKYEVNKYLVEDGIGDISEQFEGDSLNEFSTGTLNVKLFNEDNALCDFVNKTGALLRDCISSTVTSVFVSGALSATGLSTYGRNLVGHKITFITGKARNKTYDIVKYATGNITTDGNCYTDGVITNDEFVINIEPVVVTKVYCYYKTGVASDMLLKFGGVCKAENITYDNVTGIITLRCYGFLKLLEDTLALKASDEYAQLCKIHGFKITHYSTKNATYITDGVRKIKYKFPSSSKSFGFSINQVSQNTPRGIKLLRFRTPDYFQWDGGNWTKVDSDAISIEVNRVEELVPVQDYKGFPLVAQDGNNILVDLAPSNYPKTDADYLVNIQEEGATVSGNNIGGATVSFDGSDPQDVIFMFRKMWRGYSSTLTSLTDITQLYYTNPIILINTQPIVYVYFTSESQFGGIEFVGLRNSSGSAVAGTWQYSKTFGIGDGAWEDLVVVDETNGLSNDGVIRFDIPLDWQKKGKVGTGDEPSTYCVRFISSGTSSTTVTANTVLPINVVIGTYGDALYFSVDYKKLPSSDGDDDIIIKKNVDGTYVPCYWKSNNRVVDIVAALVANTEFANNYSSHNFQKTNLSKTLSIWGQPPRFNYDKKVTAFLVYGTNIVVGVENELWYVKEDTNFELIHSFPDNHTIVALNSYLDSVTGIVVQEPLPKDTYTNTLYHEVPKTILFNYSNFSATTRVLVETTYVADTSGGVVDCRTLLRSGVNFNAGGSVYPSAIGNFLSTATENICIPFPQVLIALRTWENTSENDIEYDYNALLQSITNWNGDLKQPLKLDVGFYGYYATSDAMKTDSGFKYSLGQKGIVPLKNTTGFLIYKSTANTYARTLNKIWFDGVSGTFKYTSLSQNVTEGALLTFPTLYSAQFLTRHTLLCGCDAKQDGDLNETCVSIIRDYYLQNEALETDIELCTGSLVEPLLGFNLETYRYNGTTTELIPAGTSFSSKLNDVIYLVSQTKFTDITMITNSITANYSLSVSDGSGGWYTPNAVINNSTFVKLVSNEINGKWKTDVVPGMSASGYVMRLTCTVGSPHSVVSIKSNRKVIWTNKLSAYYSGGTLLHSYTPLDMVYYSSKDTIVGGLLDRVNLTYSIFSLNMNTARTTNNNPMTVRTTNLDPSMQPKDFVYNPVDNKIYFVQTDCRTKTKPCKLFSFDGTTIKLETTLYPNYYDSSGIGVDTNGKLFGVVSNETKSKMWQYSESYYLRIPFANFEENNTRQVLAELAMLGNSYLRTNENGLLTIQERVYNNSVVGSFGYNEVVKLGEVSNYKNTFNGIKVSWDDTEYSGEIRVGTVANNTKSYEVSSNYIQDPFIASIIGNELFKTYKAMLKVVDVQTTYLIQYELFDGVKLNIKRNDMLLGSSVEWIIIGYSIDNKDGLITFYLLEK